MSWSSDGDSATMVSSWEEPYVEHDDDNEKPGEMSEDSKQQMKEAWWKSPMRKAGWENQCSFPAWEMQYTFPAWESW